MTEAPIQWRNLRLREWLALVVAAPLLGWALMVRGFGLSSEGRLDREAIRDGLVHPWWNSFAVLLAGLAAIGIILGLLGPRLNGFAAASVMTLVILFEIDDFLEYEQGNIIGGVIALQVMLTGLTVFLGWLFTGMVREWRQAHPS